MRTLGSMVLILAFTTAACARPGGGSGSTTSVATTPASTSAPARTTPATSTPPRVILPTVAPPNSAAPASPTPPPVNPLALASMPPRPPGAPTGRDWLTQTNNLPRVSSTQYDREAAIYDAISSGNVPDYNRTFVEVTLTIPGHTAVVEVLPDYLAIGSNDDNVRIPMDPYTGQKLADLFGCVLPTRKLVDAIWDQAVNQLEPKPIPPSAQMMSNDYYRQEADLVDAEMVGKPVGVLTAGDKKDVISSNAIAAHPGRVIIYGWHQLNGVAIQPLSWIHEATYADYSHGIRLVNRIMTVDGVQTDVATVLGDPSLCALLSDEGPIASPSYP